MAASYPGSIKSFVSKSDGVDWVLAAHVNDIQDEVNAIETELGTDVAGSLTDLKTRLAVSLDNDGTLKLSAITEHTGISDNNIVEVDGTSASGEWARWTANGITGYSSAEVISTWRSQGLIGINNNDLLEVDDDNASSGEYAKFTSTGLEGRSVTDMVNEDLLEDIQDAVGDMTTGNTETGIEVNYRDADGTIDFEICRAVVEIVLLDDTTSVTVQNAIGAIRYFVPEALDGWKLTDADACVTTASTSGTPTFQVYNTTDSQDMLSTAITIDANEKTSYTAATAAVVNALYEDVAKGDEIQIDCDVAGTGTEGLQVILVFEKPEGYSPP